jgi:hypothetical protein
VISARPKIKYLFTFFRIFYIPINVGIQGQLSQSVVQFHIALIAGHLDRIGDRILSNSPNPMLGLVFNYLISYPIRKMTLKSAGFFGCIRLYFLIQTKEIRTVPNEKSSSEKIRVKT